jgi:hypothetical protein
MSHNYAVTLPLPVYFKIVKSPEVLTVGLPVVVPL